MKDVFIIFIVLLVLLLIISTLGGSIRQREKFNNDMTKPLMTDPTSMPLSSMTPPPPPLTNETSLSLPEPPAVLQPLLNNNIEQVQDEQKVDNGMLIEAFDNVQSFAAY